MRLLLGIVLTVATVASCVVFTGGTSGYEREPAPTCASKADCDSGICCATFSGGAVTYSCQDTCTGLTSAQLCLVSNECLTSTCTSQVCADASVLACGLLSVCTAAPGDGPFDAGTNPIDASTSFDAGTNPFDGSSTFDAAVPDSAP